jgi:hypothetical protein
MRLASRGMLAGMNARTPVPLKPDFSARARSDLLVPRAAAALFMAQRRLFSERAVTRDGIAALVQAGPRLSGNGFGECDGYHEMGDLRLAL